MQMDASDNPVEASATSWTSRETRASMFDRLRSSSGPDRERAWSQFHHRYAPIIAGFARRCGASQQDVDDIIQDVVAAFFSVSGGFAYDPAKGRFRSWLKTCTVRAAVRRAGKNLRFRGVALEDVPQLELAVEPMWADVWEEQLVSRALDELRQAGSESLAFRAFEQYVLLDRDAAEVARQLNTSLDNVHQAKSRMTRRLRELVARLRQEEDDG